MKRSLFMSAVAVGLLTVACTPQPLKVEVDEDERSLTFNDPTEEHQVHVLVLDRNSNVITTPKMRWYVKNPRVAEVSKNGVIVPKNDGKTEVIARSGYAQREIPVEVRFFASIEPSEKKLILPVDEGQELTARVFDRQGQEIEDAEIVWVSRDPTTAVIEDESFVVGISPGTTTIIGQAGGVRTEIEVEVIWDGESPAS
jgi:pullulanase